MITRMESARIKKEITNWEVPPQGNRATSQEQAPLGDQVHANPPNITDGDIRTTFIILAQSITTQAQSIST